MNVDIEKLRKGIMPEFPKKPPAEMIIDGYHQDSKLKPKEPSEDVYLKLDPKDLIRNHRLKQKEADEMMKTIDMNQCTYQGTSRRFNSCSDRDILWMIQD